MSLDSQRAAIEGRPQANVGDRPAALGFAFQQRARDVHASGGEQFLLGAQIKRWESEFAAGSGAADDFPGQHKWPSEQAPRLRYIAFCNFAPNDGAGDHLAMSVYRGEGDHFESVGAAKFAQKLGVAGLLVTKSEIFTDQHGSHAQLFDKEIFNKFLLAHFV